MIQSISPFLRVRPAHPIGPHGMQLPTICPTIGVLARILAQLLAKAGIFAGRARSAGFVRITDLKFPVSST